MMYGFFCKQDSKREYVDKGHYSNLEEAVVGFAQRKQLTIDLFLEMYEVIPL